jgi:hypothetical protein
LHIVHHFLCLHSNFYFTWPYHSFILSIFVIPPCFNSLIRHLLFLYSLSFMSYWFPFSVCPGLPTFVHPTRSFILCQCCCCCTLCPLNFFHHSVFCFTELT